MIKKLLKACLRAQFALFICFAFTAKAQLLTWSPDFIKETDSNIDIIADATKGNQGLMGYASPVYVHIGVITNFSTSANDWKYVPFTWGTTPAAAAATSLGGNKWKYTIASSLRTFFGISNPSEKILKVAILFRSASGSNVLRNADGSDMYVPVYEAGLNVRIDQPFREPKYTPVTEPITAAAGDPVAVSAKASESSAMSIWFNGTQVATSSAVTSISTSINAVSGDNQIIAEANNGSVSKYDTIQFYINTPVVVASQPAGTVDGINYSADNTSATLVLYAPNKTRAAVIGDFNSWTQTASYQMYRTPDGSRYWITLTGLTPGTEYAFQYLIDGNLRVADIYSEKVLDPWNDQYIPAANYPSLKPYPAGQSQVVSVLQTAKPAYSWTSTTFTRPDKRNLIVYELLLRDFVAAQNWQTLKDTISYLKRLGVNAIEVMPFNEFEGNNSWGYNPDFYLAPDKMYGTENALKQFIDVCHANGIAVIMDIAMNHAFGLSPTVRMYWDAANNKPASNNPWHNPDAKHPYNVGYDFNHESQATKDLVHRVIRHWLVNYRIDGFRWDLSKGFTQTNTGSNVSAWSAYDASRIAIWKRIYDSMQVVSTGSYCILEHFADNSEETELANYGMLLWGNLNYNFNEATKGNVANSNFQWGVHVNRGWTVPHLVTYQESHDEERLMYRNLNEGASGPFQNTRDPATALKRMEEATAFWAMIPGPKMLWQFGELGYDQSINRCENGTINSGCRTNPKPILWNYYTDPNRQALYNVYARLFALRNHPAYLPTFVSNNVDYSLSGAFKWMKVTSGSLRICVIGNFDIAPVTGSVAFQTPGTWYDYLGGGTFVATGSSQNFTLQPGEYHVYLDRDANAALPLQLLSFHGQRNKGSIRLDWTTSNENGVARFEVQRSFDGNSFTGFGLVEAKNQSAIQYYQLTDETPQAVNAAAPVFYRLKMIDKDGSFRYSSIVEIGPSWSGISIYPNPVKQGKVFVRTMNQPGERLRISIQDPSGRTCLRSVIPVNGSTAAIDVAGLAGGIYFLMAELNGSVRVYPLVIP
ncbi:MAG TPA: alpha-amylase family glycosyl hydrolase [Chitinophagaceae bacterium]